MQIPPTAVHLRHILNLAQIIQSHALSFFYLSSPDLLLGMDADPARRNLLGVAQMHPQLARDGIRLRQIGQQIIELLGGKRIHPAWVVPGGVSEPLTQEKYEQILAMLPEGFELALRTLIWFKSILFSYEAEIRAFGSLHTLFLALTNKREQLEMYDGSLRLVGGTGDLFKLDFYPENYAHFIGEAVEPTSYLKSTFIKSMGYPSGTYRVGPLARLNVAKSCGTPYADEALDEFRHVDTQSSFHYHYARLIEILYCFEKIEELLHTPDILSDRVRANAQPNSEHGIGVSEAPRGTLIHDYEIDRDGLITRANLIIATGHNNYAMDRSVFQVAQQFVHGAHLSEGMLNRVEAVIRTFDPCLSCSTHAIGKMPLEVQLVAPSGEIVEEVRR